MAKPLSHQQVKLLEELLYMRRMTIIDSEKQRIGNQDGIRMIELCQDPKEIKEAQRVQDLTVIFFLAVAWW